MKKFTFSLYPSLMALSVFSLFYTATFSQGLTWNNTGIAGFSAAQADFTTMSISKTDNTIYVAYKDGAISNKLTVMRYNGVNWSLLGTAGISTGAVENISIVAAGTEVYCSFTDLSASNRLTIFRWNGTTWANDGSTTHSSSTVNSTSLAINLDGEIYVAYNDAGASLKAYVKKRIGGIWTSISPTGISTGGANDLDIACDSSNNPIVVYSDASLLNKATVKKYNGTSWVTLGSNGFTTNAVASCAIAIDRLNMPIIVFKDANTADKASVYKFNNSSWVVVGASGISTGIADYCDITIDYGNKPYIVYKDAANGNKATVRYFTGTAWATVVNVGISSGVADYTSIDIDNMNTIHVAFKDAGVANKSVVKELSCSGPSTPTITPPGGNFCASFSNLTLSTTSQLNTTFSWYKKLEENTSTGDYLDLNDNSITDNAAFSATTDASNNIFIIKMRKSDSNIIVKRYISGAWSSLGTSPGKSSGHTSMYATDIAFQTDGTLYIAYLNNSGYPTVKKYLSNNWVDVSPIVTQPCRGIAFKINSYGKMVLATNKFNGTFYNPTVFLFDGSSWENTPSVNASNDNAAFIDVTFDYKGSPVIAYTFGAGVAISTYNIGTPIIYKLTGNVWVNLNYPVTTNGEQINIDYDTKNNILYAGIANSAPSNNRKPFVHKLTDNSSIWIDITPNLFWTRSGFSMQLDNFGTPYLACMINNSSSQVVSKSIKYNGSSWVDLIGNHTPLENSNTYQLYFNKQNTPYLLRQWDNGVAYVDQIEHTFLSNGISRFVNIAGKYFVTANAGCGVIDTSAKVTITQSANTNNWLGTSSSSWSNAANWGCAFVPLATDDVVIPLTAPNMPLISTGNVQVNKLTVLGNLTVSNTILNIADSLYSSGNLSTASAGTLAFNGTSLQNFYISSAIENLTIANPVGVFIRSNIIINNTLNFSLGKLYTDSLIINLGNSVTGVGANSYIVTARASNGNLYKVSGVRKTLNANQTLIFPIGTPNSYTPLTITNSNVTELYTTRAMDSAFKTANMNNHTQTSWTISKTLNGAGSPSIQFQWNTANEGSTFNRTNCRVAVATSTEFVIDRGSIAAATTVSSGVYKMTMTNISPNNDYSWGITSDATILPIQLLGFTAKKANSGVVLNWKITASSNPEKFIVEKSNDGISFKSIHETKATFLLNYETVDAGMLQNNNFYRLKMVDKNGNISYSGIIIVQQQIIKKSTLLIYPNPVKDNINVNIVDEDNLPKKATLLIFNLLGEVIYQQNVFTNSTSTINVKSFKSGNYLLKLIHSNKSSETVKFIID